MYKLQTYILVAIFLAFSAAVFAQHPLGYTPAQTTPCVPGILYVKFKATSNVDAATLTTKSIVSSPLRSLFSSIGVNSIKPYDLRPTPIAKQIGFDRIAIIHFTNTERSISKIADDFLALPEVELVCPQVIAQPCFTPNDPQIPNAYGIQKMQLPSAWDITKGDTNVVIAILDLGTNYNHEDLKNNIYINWGETGLDSKGKDKRSNGVDDDDDGFEDNWHGWDFGGAGTPDAPEPDNDPIPLSEDHNHGTITAGCAGAVPNNSKGVTGTGYNCKIMPVKITTDDLTDIPFGYQGIQYAVEHGAKIINCSWGGFIEAKYLQFLTQFVDEATAYGALIVASAGNGNTQGVGFNTDTQPFYPACLDGVLGVGATDQNDDVTGFSNFGKKIDVFAPGKQILSTTFPGNDKYNYYDGTSFSAPYVAGVAALVASVYPDWTPAQIFERLVKTCDAIHSPKNTNLYWGRVNAARAVGVGDPKFVITGYKLDGVANDSFRFYNKVYDLTVTFLNQASNATVTASLGTIKNGHIVFGDVSLGAVSKDASKSVVFRLQRDKASSDKNLTLTFTISGEATGFSQVLTLDVPIASSFNFNVGVKETAENPVSRISIYPNPAASNATLEFYLDEPTATSISISDMLGRTVLELPTVSLSEGPNRMPLPISTLAAGVYVVRLETTEGRSMMSRLIVQ